MGAIKYNIGDKVLIKDIDWYNKNKNKHGDVLVEYKLFSHGVYTHEHAIFTKNMAKYCGQTLTISEYSNMGYKMQECIDSGEDFDIWTDEMIERLVEEESIIDLTVKGEEIKKRIEIAIPEGYEYVIESSKIIFTKKKEESLIERVDDNGLPFKEWLSHKGAFYVPNGYEIKDEKGNIINTTKIVLEKRTKYPKTYEECCEVLGIDSYFEPEIRNATTEECHKFTKLMRLKRCRDAYWKLYGEEMGLGKPWEPDYNEESYEQGSPIKYVIYYTGTHIAKGRKCTPSYILSFPTEEIQDTFKENFDPDIECCKEFL